MSPKEIVNKMYQNDPFSQWLNIKFIHIDKGTCKVSLVIEEKMTNGFQIAHGGICYSLADSCLAFAANTLGHIAVTKKTSLQYIKKANITDKLTAIATPMKDEKFYIVEIVNQANEKIAHFEGEVYYTSQRWG